MGEIINKRIDEFILFLSFSCRGKNCTDLGKKSDFFGEKLNFTISYESKILDFESDDSPAINKTKIFTFSFFSSKYFYLKPVWKFYNYEE
jgi:hypothetical protein